MVERLGAQGFEIEFHSHAHAILSADFPAALMELDQVLRETRIPISEIIGSGGGEAAGTQGRSPIAAGSKARSRS